MVYLILKEMKQKTMLTIAFILLAIPSFSQLDTYTTTGLEIIFSLADVEDNGVGQSSILRFAPVINIETMFNADMSDRFGFFTGLGIRNVGYIYGHYTDPEDGGQLQKKVSLL